MGRVKKVKVVMFASPLLAIGTPGSRRVRDLAK